MFNLLKTLGIGIAFASALASLNLGDKLNSNNCIEIKSVDKIYTRDNNIIVENKFVPTGYDGTDRINGYITIDNEYEKELKYNSQKNNYFGR